jgi:hypothetical protein
MSKNDKRTFYYRAQREVKSRKVQHGWWVSLISTG